MKPRRFRLHRPGTPARAPARPAAAAATTAQPVADRQSGHGADDPRAELTPWTEADEPSVLDADLQASGADDTAVLARARQHWQQGDWASLAAWPVAALRQHPERARLALMVAAAQLQLGAGAAARPLIRMAQEWGCDRRLLSQVLVAGLHNTLGRAAALNDDPGRALIHFAAAVTTAAPGSAVHAAIQTRARVQLDQLGLSVADAGPKGPVAAETAAAAPQPPAPGRAAADPQAAGPTSTASVAAGSEPVAPLVVPAGSVQLGASRLPVGNSTPLAWVADDRHLYLAFLVDARTVRVLQRRWSDGALQQRDLSGDHATGPGDIALGLDAQGRLLLCWRTPGQALCWRHGSDPADVRPWSVRHSLPASAAARPQLLTRAGQPLLLLLDDGQLPVLLQHHNQRQEWQRLPLPSALQAGASASTLVAARDGTLHLLQVSCAPAQPELHVQHWCAEAQAGASTELAWHAQPAHDLPLSSAPQGLAITAATTHADSTAVHLLCAALHGDVAVDIWSLRLGDGSPHRQRLALPTWPALALDADGRAWLATPAARPADPPSLWRLDGTDAAAPPPIRADWPGWAGQASDSSGATERPLLLAARRENGQDRLLLLQQQSAGTDAKDQITLHTLVQSALPGSTSRPPGSNPARST